MSAREHSDDHPLRSEGRADSLVPAVRRAARILRLLEARPQRRFTLAEISERLSLPKSSVLNICGEMVEQQFLRRSLEGYQLGRRLVQLGSAYIASVDLVREFYEVCRALPDSLNAMIQLSVLDDDLNAVFLARHDQSSGLLLGLRAEIGRRVPANCTAGGKAMLAALSESDLERRIGAFKSFPTLTARSISTPSQLRDEIVRIQDRRYSVDDEEVVAGVYCVAKAAKTHHRDNGLVGISITSSKAGMNSMRRRELLAVLDGLVSSMQERL